MISFVFDKSLFICVIIPKFRVEVEHERANSANI